MIPYSACMCFNRKGNNSWTVAKSQKGVKVDAGAGWFTVKVTGNEEENNIRRQPIRMQPVEITSSEWRLLEAVKTSAVFPLVLSKFQTPQRRRNRIPVMKPDSLCSPLLDDSYTGVVQCMLSLSNRWSFNTFHLDVLTGGRSLSVLLFHLFQRYGFIETFQLDAVKVWRCFSLIESCYHSSNPYHNSVHAADVTQAMHCFLQEPKILLALTPLESMSALLAAVTHDLDHPGVNQPFLIATSNHLASLYKNFSVLENHHWRMAVSCLRECGIFDHLDNEIWTQIEGYLHTLILATDITRQQEFLSKFKRFLEGGLLKLEDPTYRHFILQIALKCADLCNPCRPWLISQSWSQQICLEFYKQGDYERKLKLPLTPICDRSKSSVAKIQADFFRFVVTPLFEIWDKFLDSPLSLQLIGNLGHNQATWDTQVAALNASLPKQNDPKADSSPEEADKSPLTMGPTEDDLCISGWNRRCSMPLSLPKLHPRPTLRRQSFPHAARSPLTLRLSSYPIHRSPHMSLRTLSSEQLQPKTSIVSLSANSHATSLLGLFGLAESQERKLVHQPMSYPPFSAGRQLRDSDLDMLEEYDVPETPTDDSKTLLLVDLPQNKRRKSGSSESDCSNGGCSETRGECQPPAPENTKKTSTKEAGQSSDQKTNQNDSGKTEETQEEQEEKPSVADQTKLRRRHLQRAPKVTLEVGSSSPDLPDPFLITSEALQALDKNPLCSNSPQLSSWCSHVSRSLSEERNEAPSCDFDSPVPSWKSSNSSLSGNSSLARRRGSAPVGLTNPSSEHFAMSLDQPDLNVRRELVRRHSFGILESFVATGSSESGSSTDPTSTGTTCSTRRNSQVLRTTVSRLNSLEPEGSCSSESHDLFPGGWQIPGCLLNRRRGSLPTDVPLSVHFIGSNYEGEGPNVRWEHSRRRASAGEVFGALVGSSLAMAAFQEVNNQENRVLSRDFQPLEILGGLWRSRTCGEQKNFPTYAQVVNRKLSCPPGNSFEGVQGVHRKHSIPGNVFEGLDAWLDSPKVRKQSFISQNVFGSMKGRQNQRRGSVPVDVAYF